MDTKELLGKILMDYNSFYHDNNPEKTSKDRTKSFIYKYFLNEKKHDIARFTERESDFFRGLSHLIKGAKIEKSSDLPKLSDKNVTIRDNYLLLAISRIAFEADWIDEDELAAVIRKTRKIKKVPHSLLQKNSPEYKAAWNRCQRMLLQKTICDFFNSKGFIVNDSGSNDLNAKKCSTKMRRSDDRKERDLVHLCCEYLEYTAEHSEQREEKSRKRYTSSINDYKKDAEYLLRAIDKDATSHKRYKKDIIPLYFDSNIGAGIYLIGAAFFKTSAIDANPFAREMVCIPCIVSFFSVNVDENNQFVYAEEMENHFFSIKAGFEMDVELFESLDKAFSALEKYLDGNKFEENYALLNQGVCPLEENTDTDVKFRNIMT